MEPPSPADNNAPSLAPDGALGPGPEERLRMRRVVLALGLCAYLALVVRASWLCDDAFITFRTVDNFVHGFGLRWNPAERVQTYTHPLWLAALGIAYGLTREIYFTSIGLSIAISVAAVAVWAMAIARTTSQLVLGFVIIAFSKAFIDYSTSGLENPMTHLLLALFFARLFRSRQGRRALIELSALAGLLLLNRMDTILLVAPALAGRLWSERRSPGAIALAALGFAPFVLWELFSLFYYGSAFPNTAYAKLNHGWPLSVIAPQGIHYFVASARLDYLTPAVIAVGCLAAFLSRKSASALAALGVVLYLLYLIGIGGDFMAGRFFSAPFFVAMILLTAPPGAASRAGRFAFVLGAAILGALGPYAPPFAGTDYRAGEPREAFIDDRRVADERAFYHKHTGLVWVLGGRGSPREHEWAETGIEARVSRVSLICTESIGMVGFYAGPGVHVLDPMGLADPLLARLPSYKDRGLRIGHFRRRLPEGYPRSLLYGANHLEDADFADYYDRLRLITRGKLLDGERLKAIVVMNLAPPKLAAPREVYEYSQGEWITPALFHLPLSHVAEAPPENPADPPRPLKFYARTTGNRLYLQGPSHARAIELGLSGGHRYDLLYVNGEELIGRANLDLSQHGKDEVVQGYLQTSSPVRARGFDSLRVLTVPPGQADFHLYHLELFD